MIQTSLFEPSETLGDRLRPRLAGLASHGVFIGTSSWKYEGWLNQVYSGSRYETRGRFSRKKFEAECLAEYARTFPTVCGDFAFYQFPSEQYWRSMFRQAAPPFLFSLKVPEEVTCRRFPQLPRYGERAGTANPNFLNASLFQGAFLDLLAPFAAQLAVLIFEFGSFSGYDTFLLDLDRFLAALPGGFRYAVEIRNPELLVPDYFACLRAHGVAHTFNQWTRMPDLARQIEIGEAYTAPFSVARALLRSGRSYEEAVRLFSPYERIQDEQPDLREALRKLIRREQEREAKLFLYVNNRLEGNAPMTIDAIV